MLVFDACEEGLVHDKSDERNILRQLSRLIRVSGCGGEDPDVLAIGIGIGVVNHPIELAICGGRTGLPEEAETAGRGSVELGYHDAVGCIERVVEVERRRIE